jgi:hypothetical protein
MRKINIDSVADCLRIVITLVGWSESMQECDATWRLGWNVSRITESLFLGDLSFAENERGLGYLGIGAVVSVLEEDAWPDLHESIACLGIDLEDDPSSESIFRGAIRKVVNFVQRQIRLRKRVLVHCAAGRSRSPAFVVAYLMRHGVTPYDWSLTRFENAHQLVAEKRPIRINMGFISALRQYSNRLYRRRRRKLLLVLQTSLHNHIAIVVALPITVLMLG